jgi:hypothetical protein
MKIMYLSINGYWSPLKKSQRMERPWLTEFLVDIFVKALETS